MTAYIKGTCVNVQQQYVWADISLLEPAFGDRRRRLLVGGACEYVERHPAH